jgi:hypothetical protein
MLQDYALLQYGFLQVSRQCIWASRMPSIVFGSLYDFGNARMSTSFYACARWMQHCRYVSTLLWNIKHLMLQDYALLQYGFLQVSCQPVCWVCVCRRFANTGLAVTAVYGIRYLGKVTFV